MGIGKTKSIGKPGALDTKLQGVWSVTTQGTIEQQSFNVIDLRNYFSNSEILAIHNADVQLIVSGSSFIYWPLDGTFDTKVRPYSENNATRDQTVTSDFVDDGIVPVNFSGYTGFTSGDLGGDSSQLPFMALSLGAYSAVELNGLSWEFTLKIFLPPSVSPPT